MVQSDLRHVTLNTSDVQLISHLNYDAVYKTLYLSVCSDATSISK